MKIIKFTVLVALFLISTSVAHKYYVSVTQIEYVSEKSSLQIITRIDVDDLELTLQERYDKSIDLTTLNEKPTVDDYLIKYLKAKLNIKVNSKNINFTFLGKKYDNDQVVCYLEATDIKDIKSIEVKNTVLFDNFPEQKNVLKITMFKERFNRICSRADDTEQLNF